MKQEQIIKEQEEIQTAKDLIEILSNLENDFAKKDFFLGTDDQEDLGLILFFVKMIVGVLIIFTLITLTLLEIGYNISKISDYRLIPDKINITEESNKEIEKQLQQLVEEYITYEKNTIENVKPENVIAIAQAYPDLRSQTLVSELMKNYNDNNKELKKLKLKQIELRRIKWNLYFGG